jgi:FkbM family methyltransferase
MIEDCHFLLRCLRYRFRTERLQIKTVMSLNLKGSTALDIGANKGIYCYWLSKAVGPDGRVVAFEPQPEMVAYISRRHRHFPGGNVRILPNGLSDRPQSALLARDYAGHGSASLDGNRLSATSEKLSIPLKRLDDMGEITNLKFIKCDVEGHELKVFEGGRETIKSHLPVVQFESLLPDTPLLFEFFFSLGYSGLMFLDDRYLPLAQRGVARHPKFGLDGHRDFLFFHPRTASKIIPRALFNELQKATALPSH